MTAFLVGGTPFKTRMPLGTYTLKYASGQTWYGKKLRFGSETQYAKADKDFHFYADGSRIHGVRIELILQVSGNLTQWVH